MITVGEPVILRRAEIQAQPLCQLKQPLQPFARLNHAVNGADHDNDQHRHNQKWHGKWHLGLHEAVLNQSRGSGHYNFRGFLQTHYSISVRPITFI